MVERRPFSVRTGFTPTIETDAGLVAAPVGWEYTGVAVPRGTTLSPDLQLLSDALQARHDAVVSAVVAPIADLATPAGGNVIQLGSSGNFVAGDFSGGLQGSSGAQGSVLVDLISKGIDLATAFATRGGGSTAQSGVSGTVMVPNRKTLPSLPEVVLGKKPESRGFDLLLPSGAGGRRRRRMNVLNPRALRRSMRRVQGFAKFATKTISFTKRVRMKKRRR